MFSIRFLRSMLSQMPVSISRHFSTGMSANLWKYASGVSWHLAEAQEAVKEPFAEQGLRRVQIDAEVGEVHELRGTGVSPEALEYVDTLDNEDVGRPDRYSRPSTVS